MSDVFDPKIVAFVCNWCTYTGADLAGTSRIQYASNVRIIKLPCTGRISPLFVIRALAQGADGVLVSGCHPGDCHYTAGNYHARRKFTMLREMLEFVGIEPERVQFSWVSAAEGRKWAEVVNDVVAGVRKVGPRRVVWGDAGTRGRGDGETRGPSAEFAREVFQAQTAELQTKARELLESGAVKAVIGYRAGTLPGVTRALFAKSADDAGELVWNEYCHLNLSTYLTRDVVKKLGKVAVVVKACDAKSVVGLLQENQIAREDVVLISMACQGVEVDGKLALKCAACDHKAPAIADYTVGKPAGPPLAPPNSGGGDPRFAEIARLEAMAPADRWGYWQAQFERCIRCYACRSACPLCTCDRCIADKSQPRWVPGTPDGRGNMSWHASRALHLAGRCIDCGNCTEACPAGIRLDLLNLKLAQVVRDRFDYVPGLDPAAAPALASFREEDAQEFIR